MFFAYSSTNGLVQLNILHSELATSISLNDNGYCKISALHEYTIDVCYL